MRSRSRPIARPRSAADGQLAVPPPLPPQATRQPPRGLRRLRPAAWSGRRRRIAASLLGIGLLLFVGGAVWLLAGLPSTESLVTRASPDSTKILDRNGALLYELLDPRAGRRTRVALAELPPVLPAAVIAVEDAGFYANPGVEARGVARAIWQMVRERRVVSGGSTITQQLARQLLLSPGERVQRSLRRKLREMLLALAITRRYDKDQILELYLNEVYFGQLAYGVDAASQTYFGKPARALDLAEAALLAGLIQSPATYNPLVDWDAARARQSVVLDLMVKAGLAEPQAAELARAEPLRMAGGNVPLEAPHFVSWVQSRLELRYGAERVSAGGLNVITSLDLDLQREAEAIVRRRIAELARRQPGKPDHQASDAALVALSPETGQVLAMVGSADYFDAEIDGAVNVALALRQPGSSIKPLTYASAFDVTRWGTRPPGPDPSRPRLPFSPATVLLDLPTSFVTREGEPYRPLNYDRSWHGPIGLRRALASSSNLVAVKVLEAVGVDALIDSAEALGIDSLRDRERYGLALTLGGGEVRLLELTAAYAGLAAGGRRVEPEPILAVLDAAGLAELRAGDPGFERLHARSSVAATPAIDPRAAWLVTDILADDAARLPAFGEASVLALDRPAAAKTGTTTDFRDNWTLGYTPDLAVGVWLGNADGRPMRWISGISGAGPIWQDLMLRAHLGRPQRDFVRPDGLRRVEICEAGGLLPGEGCRRRRFEWFVAGTEPVDLDPSYQVVEVAAQSGLPWAPGCAGAPTRRVFRVLPAEALDWARRAGIEPAPDRDCLGRPFRLALQTEPEAPPPAAGAPTAALRLDSPASGSTFALSPGLPRAAQRLELRALPLVDTPFARVRLELDGRLLASPSRPPYRIDWPLEPGRHAARAVAETADGRQLASEIVHFDVVEEAEIE